MFEWIISLIDRAGYLLLAQYDQVRNYLNPIATVVPTIMVTTYVVRLISWKRG